MILALYIDPYYYQKMKCRLCLKKSQLVQPHIIPEFMFECSGLYDEKHRFLIIEKRDDTPKFKQRQKGLRERLLCKECETRISRWERYARSTIYGPGNPKKVRLTGEGVALFDDVEYKRFKLFLLSMLWRMSVSSLKEFSRVNLGRHAKTIRSMLLGDDPGNEDDYGCFLTSVIFDSDDLETNENLRRFMLHPERIRADGHICYRIFIGGFLYVFVVSKHNIPAKIRGLFLNRSNQLPVLIRRADAVPLVSQSLSDFQTDIKQWRHERHPS